MAADRMTAKREQEIREHLADSSNYTLGNLAARDLLAEVERLRATLREACDHVAEQDDKIGELSAENHALKTRLNAASTVKCWTNEDGKRFVFANDLAEALGYKAGEGR